MSPGIVDDDVLPDPSPGENDQVRLAIVGQPIRIPWPGKRYACGKRVGCRCGFFCGGCWDRCGGGRQRGIRRQRRCRGGRGNRSGRGRQRRVRSFRHLGHLRTTAGQERKDQAANQQVFRSECGLHLCLQVCLQSRHRPVRSHDFNARYELFL
jgi:hypothetical protein